MSSDPLPQLVDEYFKKKFSKPSKPIRAKRKKGKIVPAKGKTEWGRIYEDGREVCDDGTVAGRQEYAERRLIMWCRDQGKCCICGRFVTSVEAEFEHAEGRGFNGSHRDDRIEKNGVAHHGCNSKKGSKRALPPATGGASDSSEISVARKD